VEALDSVLEKRFPGSREWGLKAILSAPCSSCLDSRPLAGPLPGCSKTLVLTGLDGVGVTLAPRLASVIADYIIESRNIPGFYSTLRTFKDAGARPPEPYKLCP